MKPIQSLTREELDRLIAEAAKHSTRDALMFRVTFNHGLRVTEAVTLSDANVINGYLTVDREKNSNDTTQRILADEQELLTMKGKFFPISRVTFWRRMQDYGLAAGLPEHKCHPHALRHTTGRLAYKGGLGVAEIQSILGHKNGGNSMIYMQADESEAYAAFAAAVGK